MRLSICIPTRNRASVLEAALNSITSTATFGAHSDIEVVVSDNASTDQTGAVAQHFIDRFPGRIRYHSNPVNVGDSNFELALRMGRGRFLKLANDTLHWSQEGLSHLYELVGVCDRLRPTLFFLNSARPTSEPVMIPDTPDELLSLVSFQMGWIGSFGIWRDDLVAMSDFSRRAHGQMGQVDVLCRLLAQDRGIVVSNVQLARVLDVGRKGGYSLAKVFAKEYVPILESSGLFSAEALAREKRAVLLEHVLPWHFDMNHDFGIYPLEEYLDPVYGQEPYYRDALAQARQLAEERRAVMSPQQLVQHWRQRNQNNETHMARLFDPSRVTVGKGSYGPLDVRGWGHPEEQLCIGHYVSIAEGVTFVLGGNHIYKGFSTFPFTTKLLGRPHQARTKGAIIVQDDVWICTNAMILSGVTVGKGAIIGAGAVVASDVPPYAIVTGNPARVTRYRFSPAVIERLMDFDFSRVDPAKLAVHGDLLEAELTEDNVDGILARLEGRSDHDVAASPATA